MAGGYLHQDPYHGPCRVLLQLDATNNPFQETALENPQYAIALVPYPAKGIFLPADRDKAKELDRSMAVEVVSSDHRRLIDDAWQANGPIQMLGITYQLPYLRKRKRQHLFSDELPGFATHRIPLHVLPQGFRRFIIPGSALKSTFTEKSMTLRKP
jgi:hypothetical protein